MPSIARALLLAGWFGIQCWVGGSALNQFLSVIIPFWYKFKYGIAISFLSFWLSNILIALYGTQGIKILESFGVPFLMILCFGLVLWSYYGLTSMGFSVLDVFRISNNTQSDTHFIHLILILITANVGGFSGFILQIQDFSRYFKNQRTQLIAQAISFPIALTGIAFVGIFVTGSCYLQFGEYLWDPIAVIAKIESPFASVIGSLGLIIATLTTNIAANVYAPANSISNLFPKYISYTTGVIITGVIGLIIQPWKLMSSSNAYFKWLVTSGIFLGPIPAILISQYFIIFRQNLNLYYLYQQNDRTHYHYKYYDHQLIHDKSYRYYDKQIDLKREKNPYWYIFGVNWWAFAVWFISCFFPILGLFLYQFSIFTDNGWVIGFFSALLLFPLPHLFSSYFCK